MTEVPSLAIAALPAPFGGVKLAIEGESPPLANDGSVIVFVDPELKEKEGLLAISGEEGVGVGEEVGVGVELDTGGGVGGELGAGVGLGVAVGVGVSDGQPGTPFAAL